MVKEQKTKRLCQKRMEEINMILADKIIDERKKNGWSQEELADKLGVSRQAVSKWESAQSVPDLQRILEMSRLFGVSTDYLLKDEEGVRTQDNADEFGISSRTVSLEDANEYLEHNRTFSKKISLGVVFCVLCPVPLLLLLGFQQAGWLSVTENTASAIGVIALFGFIAAGLALFIPSGIANSRYGWMDTEAFDTAYGVTGMVRERAEAYHPTFVSHITTGVLMILGGVVAVVAGAFFGNDGVTILMVSVLLILIAFGVRLFVTAGIISNGYSKLLQEGDFSKAKKARSEHSLMQVIAPVYWLAATAGFLFWGFAFDGWGKSWIIWPIAGVVFALIAAVVNYAEDK